MSYYKLMLRHCLCSFKSDPIKKNTLAKNVCKDVHMHSNLRRIMEVIVITNVKKMLSLPWTFEKEGFRITKHSGSFSITIEDISITDQLKDAS